MNMLYILQRNSKSMTCMYEPFASYSVTKQPYSYLDIVIEDMREYDKALAYIRKLSPYEVKQEAFVIVYAWLTLITIF